MNHLAIEVVQPIFKSSIISGLIYRSISTNDIIGRRKNLMAKIFRKTFISDILLSSNIIAKAETDWSKNLTSAFANQMICELT